MPKINTNHPAGSGNTKLLSEFSHFSSDAVNSEHVSAVSGFTTLLKREKKQQQTNNETIFRPSTRTFVFTVTRVGLKHISATVFYSPKGGKAAITKSRLAPDKKTLAPKIVVSHRTITKTKFEFRKLNRNRNRIDRRKTG